MFRPLFAFVLLLIGVVSSLAIPPAAGRAIVLRSGSTEVRLHAPAGWKVITAQEEPMDWSAAADSPRRERQFGVDLRKDYAGLSPEKQQARYLAAVHRTHDPKVQISPEAPLTLPDGRTVTPYRYSSSYWKERLVVIIPEGNTAFILELLTPSRRALAASRPDVEAIFASYRSRH